MHTQPRHSTELKPAFRKGFNVLTQMLIGQAPSVAQERVVRRGVERMQRQRKRLRGPRLIRGPIEKQSRAIAAAKLALVAQKLEEKKARVEGRAPARRPILKRGRRRGQTELRNLRARRKELGSKERKLRRRARVGKGELAGLGGRTKSEKRADRAAWLNTMSQIIAADIDSGLENLSTGRTKFQLPAPGTPDPKAMEEWERLLAAFVPGSEAELAEALGYTIPQLDTLTDPKVADKFVAKKRKAAAPSAAALLPFALLFLL